jgi:imidazolonepropionase
MDADLIIRSNCIVTCRERMDTEIVNGYILISDGKIAGVADGEIPAEYLQGRARLINAKGKIVTPGLVDSHTHLIHAGSREKELTMKLNEIPNIDILKMGGGILSTVESTRRASKQELKDKARESLDKMLIHGTTTIEAKSGYGLDLDTEVKCLEALRELGEEHDIDITRTYMGAHAIPVEYKKDKTGYIQFMIQTVMPFVAENGLAEFMDVFCEDGAFSPGETMLLMSRGKDLGFKLKVHADEIVPLRGAELAAEMGAVSAEHLMATSDEGLDAMSKAGVTAVLLPGKSFYLMAGKYAQARKMIQKGVRVAIATDYNPGSCPTENLQTAMTFACLGMKLLPEEILKGMTINAAHAINRDSEIGSIEKGKKADLVIFNVPNLDYLVYHFGINHAEKVIKNGKLVVENCWKRRSFSSHGL